MATYLLLHGAASDHRHWDQVAPQLAARGHRVVAPDLPSDDDRAGLSEYADAAVAALGPADQVILVAQSLAGFVAPLVCQRAPVDLLVLVAAMVPRPGESAGQWWDNTGQPAAERALAEQEGRDPDAPFDPVTLFLHDLAPEALQEALRHPPRRQSTTIMEQPWPLTAWPSVPTRFLLCRRDRLFPAEFQRQVVRERLGIEPDELDSGHLPALSRPEELVGWLERYRVDAGL